MAMRRFGSDRGQSLVVFLLVLPVMILMAGMVIDGGNAFAHKRQVQNAADASALAAVQDLGPVLACTDDVCRESYRDDVRDRAQEYSLSNGGSGTLHVCADRDSNGFPNGDPEDNNCYTWPYKGSWAKVEVKLKRSVDGFFTQFLGLAVDFFKPAARSVAALESTSTPHCSLGDSYLPTCVIPGTPDTPGVLDLGSDAHCTFDPPVANPDSYLPDCIIPGPDPVVGTYQPPTDPHCVFEPPVANPDQYLPQDCVIPGQANSAFAASTNTSAITLSGSTKTFDTLQTNGCVRANAVPANSFARELWVGKKGTCSQIPTTFEPNGPISAATKTGSTVTLTTSLSQGFNGWKVGDQIIVSGVSIGGYNGTFTIASMISSTQLTYGAGNSTALANSSGGMVRDSAKYIGPCGGANFPCPSTPTACDNSYASPATCGLPWPINPVTRRNAIQALCDAQGHNYADLSSLGGAATTFYNQSWLNTHAGVYCFSSGISFSIGTGPLTYEGYTFMAPTISVTNSGNNSIFHAPSPSGSNTVFFAKGGLLDSGYCSSTSNNLVINQPLTVVGQLLDPCGSLTLNSGNQVFTGFIEAFKITLTGAETYFIGTGPGGTSTAGVFHPGTAAHCTFDPPVANPDDYLPDCVIPGPGGQTGEFHPGSDSHCDFTGADPPVPMPWDDYLLTDPPCTAPGTPDDVGVITNDVTPGDVSMDE